MLLRLLSRLLCRVHERWVLVVTATSKSCFWDTAPAALQQQGQLPLDRARFSRRAPKSAPRLSCQWSKAQQPQHALGEAAVGHDWGGTSAHAPSSRIRIPMAVCQRQLETQSIQPTPADAIWSPPARIGLTLGLLSLDRVGLEVLKRSGTEKERKHAAIVSGGWGWVAVLCGTGTVQACSQRSLRCCGDIHVCCGAQTTRQLNPGPLLHHGCRLSLWWSTPTISWSPCCSAMPSLWRWVATEHSCCCQLLSGTACSFRWFMYVRVVLVIPVQASHRAAQNA